MAEYDLFYTENWNAHQSTDSFFIFGILKCEMKLKYTFNSVIHEFRPTKANNNTGFDECA